MNPQVYLENHRSDVVHALAELVGIATVNPPGKHYGHMVEILRRSCLKLGLDVKVHQVPDQLVHQVLGNAEYPRYNLIARWDVGAADTVHFNAHYDVVPAAGKWKYGSPFEAQLRGDRLYGRGAGDMKGSIVALLAAIGALRHSRCGPAFNIECSFTADEETGGRLGAGYIVEQGLIEADYAVVCEGAAGPRVGCGHNGVLWLEVTIEGKSAHASSPERGVNAFEAMAALVGDLRRYKSALKGRARVYRDLDGQERYPTVNLGGVFGGSQGDKINTVPGRAHFSIDRRIVPGENLQEVERALRRAVRQAATAVGVKCAVRSLLRIDPCVVDPAANLPQAFARAMQAVRRHAAQFRTTTGFTDLHYFVENGGLPGIGYGVQSEHAHGPDERVRVRDVLQTAKTYAEFMVRGVG